jgi:ATP-dependent RNA helicase RhlE
MNFKELNLIEPLLQALDDQGYETPTPIQAQAIPLLLAGRDVLGCAQTGTGKTAAFALPVLQHISQALEEAPRSGKRRIRALVLSPTRELVAQIAENFKSYSRYLPIKHLVIFGGVSATPQIKHLSHGVDVLVATPGRLLDLQSQGYIKLDQVDFFILDEADRMLDMGFIHDIRRVLKLLPRKKQNLLFSATMPPNIVKLAGDFLSNPARVEVVPESTTAEKITQQVMFVEKTDKRRLLAHLLDELNIAQCIVFTRTKHGANRLVQQLERAGHESAAIHGNKSQNARTRALSAFREGTLPTLIATDIAARGIDVPGVSHVFNFDIPNESESYVHRIGRTGRAGESGIAIAFCDDSEGLYLRNIERLIDSDLEVIEDHPWHAPSFIPPPRNLRSPRRESKNNDSERDRQSRSNRTGHPNRQKTNSSRSKTPASKSREESSANTHQQREGNTSGQNQRNRRPSRRGRPQAPKQ